MKKTNSSFTRKEVIHYESRRYRGLDQKFVHTRESHILAKLFKRINTHGGWAVDLPCGYGRFSKFLAGQSTALVNMDYSFHMVHHACKKTGLSSHTLGVTADAKKNLPFKAQSFDVLLCMRFFHHVHLAKEREFILKEFSRVSKKWVVFSYYQTNILHLFQRRIRKLVKKPHANIKMISRRDMEILTTKAGLKLLKTVPLLRGIHAQTIVLCSKTQSE